MKDDKVILNQQTNESDLFIRIKALQKSKFHRSAVLPILIAKRNI